MQLNLHIRGLETRKLQAGCDGLRVRIFTKIHSVEIAGYVSYGRKGEKSTVGSTPWLKDLVWGFVGVVFGEIFPRILLGEGPFEMLKGIGIEEIVGVVWFAWWVERQRPGRGGGWGFGGGLHWGRDYWQGGQDLCAYIVDAWLTQTPWWISGRSGNRSRSSTLE